MSTKTERNEAIDYLEKEFTGVSGLYMTDFTGIDVEKITQLRADLRNLNAKYLVVKNSLAKRALEKTGMKEVVPYLKGPTGLALAKDDYVGAAKAIKEFKKKNKNLLEVKIAYVDGNLFSSEEASKLADLPSKEVLLSQLLSCLNAPLANFVGSLNGVFTKLVGTLEAVKKKRKMNSNLN